MIIENATRNRAVLPATVLTASVHRVNFVLRSCKFSSLRSQLSVGWLSGEYAGERVHYLVD